MPLKQRHIESFIHVETLKTLVEANWLRVNGILHDRDEVVGLSLSTPNSEGVITIRYTIEPDIQTYNV